MLFQFSEERISLVLYHFTVILWGFTAIIGKMISYGSLVLVWHRMSITFLVYLLVPSTWIEINRLSWKDIATFLGIGIVVCMHWVAFYGSIKLGDSASLAVACLGSCSFFASILEPSIVGTPFVKKDFIAGIVVLCGLLQVYIALPHSSPSPGVHYRWAVLVGVLSAMLASMFTILNKININKGSTLSLATIEMGAGAVLLSAIVPAVYRSQTPWYPKIDVNNLSTSTMRTGEWDLIWVVILAVFCTNCTFYLSNRALRHVSAFTANLIANLEPVYGVVLGAIVFHENRQLNFHFYIGTAIIIIAIFGNSINFTCFGATDSGTSEETDSTSIEMSEQDSLIDKQQQTPTSISSEAKYLGNHDNMSSNLLFPIKINSESTHQDVSKVISLEPGDHKRYSVVGMMEGDLELSSSQHPESVELKDQQQPSEFVTTRDRAPSWV